MSVYRTIGPLVQFHKEILPGRCRLSGVCVGTRSSYGEPTVSSYKTQDNVGLKTESVHFILRWSQYF